MIWRRSLINSLMGQKRCIILLKKIRIKEQMRICWDRVRRGVAGNLRLIRRRSIIWMIRLITFRPMALIHHTKTKSMSIHKANDRINTSLKTHLKYSPKSNLLIRNPRKYSRASRQPKHRCMKHYKSYYLCSTRSVIVLNRRAFCFRNQSANLRNWQNTWQDLLIQPKSNNTSMR